jgi:hypothetical protein
VKNKTEFEVKLGYIEIYNEQIHDMLSEEQKNLVIIEDPDKGLIINDLKELETTNIIHCHDLIDYGNSKRTRAATLANAYSSRSHAII